MRKIHKAWLIGAETPIGQAILKQIDTRIINMITTDMDDVNISDIDEALAYSYLNQPDAIINCYEFSDTKECDEDPVKAYRINSLIPRNLAICARKIGARFVHISTDNVFGQEREIPYNEFDTPNPVSTYGKSKLQGENFVKELSQKYYIVRTSYVYGEKEDILNNPYKGKRTISPTSAEELADFIIKLMNTAEYGTYHAGNTGYCTYEQFMKKFSELSGKECSIKQSADSYRDIRLEQFMLKLSNVYTFSDWEKQIEEYTKRLK